MGRDIILIGYSGHAYVVYEIFMRMGRKVSAYCDKKEVPLNPFKLEYLGPESPENLSVKLKEQDYFISIGDNRIRREIFEKLSGQKLPANAIDPSAIVSESCRIGSGVMIGAGAILNSMTEAGDGAIFNTGSIVEHECKIGKFCHLAPGSVLAGNVEVGENSFIGAGAVVKQGVKLGSNVIVGAGAVVIRDVPDNCKVVGNPARFLK
jgi:sugar O-acyltransferase (sialic acid O-acetyltransferase NeuD family)